MKLLLTILFIFSSIVGKSQVDEYSLGSCLVLATKDTTYLWNATGFFLKANSSLYFITNNHVVGGQYFIDEYQAKKNTLQLPPEDSLPNSLKIRVYDSLVGSFKWFDLNLKNSIGMSRVITFQETPGNKRSLLDVVAIPIESKDTSILRWVGVYSKESFNNDLILYPSQDLFVIGFPFDYGQSNLYPLWKKGTIASEPGFTKFFIDATTRSGMSGSPVVFRNTSVVTKGGIENYTRPVSILIGIYSAQNYPTEIGQVTKMIGIYNKLLSISK